MCEADEPGAELDALAAKVIDAALEVHRTLGPGFFESVYEGALAVELSLRGIPFRRQVRVGLGYKGTTIGHGFIDLLVDERLVVELKHVEVLTPLHVSQVLSYLRATHNRLALLITFNVKLLRTGVRRVIRSRDHQPTAT
jgi:GxxExxY protein